MEDDEYAINKMGGIKLEDGTVNGAHAENGGNATMATLGMKSENPSPSGLSPEGIKSRSESVSTPNSSKPPKLSRKASQQPPREPPLFGHLPDDTHTSCQAFQVIRDCLYGSKHLGSTDNDSLDCDCREEWRE